MVLGDFLKAKLMKIQNQINFFFTDFHSKITILTESAQHYNSCHTVRLYRVFTSEHPELFASVVAILSCDFIVEYMQKGRCISFVTNKWWNGIRTLLHQISTELQFFRITLCVWVIPEVPFQVLHTQICSRCVH